MPLKCKEKTGIELALDAQFKAIVFPAGAQGGRVANRYYGITTEGEIVARGICVRRSDSPPIVKKFQEKCIRLLLEDGDFFENYQKCFELLETEYRAIRAGAYDLSDFVVIRQIRKSVDAYKVSAAHVKAYRKAPNPHDYVEFVYTVEGPTPRAMARRELIDARQYVYLMRKSVSELRNGIQLLLKG
ncbi:MAG: DNA polymerase domain-containing protein [Candidatus Micrarchaeota archaeon]|nr:DNA polymerase domain-containing protein [Candidatus Micrarchaeota archaeon]